MQLPKVRCLFMCCLMLFCVCKLVVDDEKDKEITIEDLRITSNDISNWEDIKDNPDNDLFDGFEIYIGDEFVSSPKSPINGAGEDYMDGLEKAIIHYMKNSNNHILNAYIIDFGTSENAVTMFNEMKPNPGVVVDGYDKSVAVIDNEGSESGCNLYAHFERFYIELRFNDFSTKNEAMTTAKLFIDIYNNKMNS